MIRSSRLRWRGGHPDRHRVRFPQPAAWRKCSERRAWKKPAASAYGSPTLKDALSIVSVGPVPPAGGRVAGKVPLTPGVVRAVSTTDPVPPTCESQTWLWLADNTDR